MKRLNDNFLEKLGAELGLNDTTVLEIGCGDGGKTIALASRAKSVVAIDPDTGAIAIAKKDNTAANLTYKIGKAEDLEFADASFDVVIFSLSLHHVPIASMAQALREAARVVKPAGKVVVLEPDFIGGFFEAEVQFGSGDGDERKQKAAAHLAILGTTALKQEAEWYDQITFVFDSFEDFAAALEPTKNLDQAKVFLKAHDNQLRAYRRITIFSFPERD